MAENAPLSRDALIEAMSKGIKPKDQWRIGAEHEKFGFRIGDHSTVPYDGPDGIHAMLEGLKRHGWSGVYEDNRHGRMLIALERGQANISLEPGGQFELSGAPLETLHQTCRETNAHFAQVREVAGPLGIGFLGSMMGIGGGFLLVPALIYLLRVSTTVVIGTSSLQTLITMLMTVVFHALTNGSVDVVLALLLMIGGVIGAQFGARTSLAMKGEELRLLLGLVVLAVGVRFLVDLVVRPDDPFTTTIIDWAART